MEHEEQTRPEQTAMGTAWQAYQLWTGNRDGEAFARSFVGHYADRSSFGQELLTGLGVHQRICRLPDWLQAYIRFDGEAVVRDFERAGHFHIYEAPDQGGAFVFDPYELD